MVMELTLHRWKGSHRRVYVGYRVVAKPACSQWRRDASLAPWGETHAESHGERSGVFEYNDILDYIGLR